jgi:hypothetical protein
LATWLLRRAVDCIGKWAEIRRCQPDATPASSSGTQTARRSPTAYFEDEPGRRAAAKLLIPDEVRRIASTSPPVVPALLSGRWPRFNGVSKVLGVAGFGRVHFRFISTLIIGHREGSGGLSEVAMKTPLSIVLVAVVLVAGGSLAIMNSTCKINHHSWCGPMSDFQHRVKTRHS